MDHTDINRCIQILTERPKLFFQKENIADKLQCFDVIQNIGTPSIIYSLIGFLRSNNVLIQLKSAETILLLFRKLRSLNEYESSLKHLPIKTADLDFYRVDFDEKIYGGLLTIASLNGSGYVREKAVKELARLKDTDGLKFILLRLGDWVTEVRKAATEATLSFLKTIYTAELLKQLPIIDWLLKVERVDLTEIHYTITKFILTQDFSEEFYKKLKNLDDKTRLRFYKIYLNNEYLTREQIKRISSDKNFLVQLELIKHLPKIDINIQLELISDFLDGSSARVKQSALYASRDFSPNFDSQITILLSDEAASVRELSRYLLKEKGIDFASLYRQRITDQQFLPGSILGLSETGQMEDLPIFEKYIINVKNKLVASCLLAINKFDVDNAKQYSLQLITHPNKIVRDKAVKILAKSSEIKTISKLREIYEQGNYDVKMSILRLYSQIGGWSIVGDLLFAIKDENVNIQNMAWLFLDKWKSKATRLFTTPPPTEIDRANNIYNSIDIGNLNMTHNQAKLFQDLKFFLR